MTVFERYNLPRKKFLFKFLSKILSRSCQIETRSYLILPDLVRFGKTQVRFYSNQEIVSNSYKILQEFSRSCKILSSLDKILIRFFLGSKTTRVPQIWQDLYLSISFNPQGAKGLTMFLAVLWYVLYEIMYDNDLL